MIFKVLGSCSHYKVMESDGSANFMTFERLLMLIPRTTGVSHLYDSKPSMLKFNETRATWEVSIAWRERPK